MVVNHVKNLNDIYPDNKKVKRKYNNIKIAYKGKIYASIKEANRAAELQILERAGVIKDLKTQVKFVLCPTQRIDGKVVERGLSYYADFTYYDKKGNYVVEDTKSPATRKSDKYIIKRKLMLNIYNIRILES